MRPDVTVAADRHSNNNSGRIFGHTTSALVVYRLYFFIDVWAAKKYQLKLNSIHKYSLSGENCKMFFWNVTRNTFTFYHRDLYRKYKNSNYA